MVRVKMITLIVTTGNSSLDKYSQELSKRMKIDKIEMEMPISIRQGYNLLKKSRSYNTNIFHFPHQQFARYINFINKPCVITVHDLSLQCSLLYNLSTRMKVYLKFDILGIKRAEHIIAISEYTKNDLISLLKIPSEKISVVHQGIDHEIYHTQRVNLFNYKYVLYVGSEQPRKNLPSLLKAFFALKKKDEFKDLKLVKIGGSGLEVDRKATLNTINELGLQKDVIFTGFIPEVDLPMYYSNASCFILPSLYEGFGLPLLEAMACGCPVIASNTTAIPEVVGDAGILVDPRNINEIESAIEQVLSNEKLRENLIEKGFIQSNKFSWERTASETTRIYESLK
jgi:glycosyltransferase involved in cell wall biosynthesis